MKSVAEIDTFITMLLTACENQMVYERLKNCVDAG